MMKAQTFRTEHPNLAPLLENCMESQEGTRIEYGDWVFVKLGGEKVLAGNVANILEEIPDIYSEVGI